MLTLLGLAAVVAAVYFVRKWFLTEKAKAATVIADVEQDAVAVETKVQSEVAVAEKVAAEVVAEIKAKV